MTLTQPTRYPMLRPSLRASAQASSSAFETSCLLSGQPPAPTWSSWFGRSWSVTWKHLPTACDDGDAGGDGRHAWARTVTQETRREGL